jgi:hypothetical protein
VLGRPFRSSSRTSGRPAPKYLHHFLTRCTLFIHYHTPPSTGDAFRWAKYVSVVLTAITRSAEGPFSS